jgi:hypothetical protein
MTSEAEEIMDKLDAEAWPFLETFAVAALAHVIESCFEQWQQPFMPTNLPLSPDFAFVDRTEGAPGLFCRLEGRLGEEAVYVQNTLRVSEEAGGPVILRSDVIRAEESESRGFTRTVAEPWLLTAFENGQRIAQAMDLTDGNDLA